MGKLIMVTGGARSGKSSLAEELAKGCGENVIYVATAVPFDEEMKLRVKKHREQRPSHWETVEAYKDLDRHLFGKLRKNSAVLLDCITVMITNLMFEVCPDFDNIDINDIQKLEIFIKQEMDKIIDLVKTSEIPFIIVTNEIGMGIVPEKKASRVFRDVAGRGNQILAKAADEVHFCVSGIPIKIK